MTKEKVLIVEGVMGRWIIQSTSSPQLAWSGSHWVPHRQGIPTGGIQVSNFTTIDDAVRETHKLGFHIVGIEQELM